VRIRAQQITSHEVCAFGMLPGSVKRLPLGTGPLIGYYVTCPCCGMVNVVRAVGDGQTFVGTERLIAMTPGLPCNACKRPLVVRDGEFEFAVEVDDVAGR
jgi:hypothetical protein